jgi:hypothetical protein
MLVVALTGVGLSAGQTRAITIDAREMAMAGTRLPRSAALRGNNPAYFVVPERHAEQGRLVPIPLGLIAALADLPEFDPDAEDFDLIEVVNLIANPPWNLELREPDPLDGDITIDLSEQNLRIYWEDASVLLDDEPVDIALRLDRFGGGYGRPHGADWRWRVQVTPYIDGSARAEIDDALYGVLALGDTLKANSTYGLAMEVDVAAGLSSRFLIAGRVSSESETELYVAVGPKLIAGFAMVDSDADFTGTTGPTSIASDSLDLSFAGDLRYTDDFAPGYGFGLDLGLALRRGPWDLGAGVRDLAGAIRFPRTTLERQYMEDSPSGTGGGTSDVIKETVEEDVAHTYFIKPYWTFNAAHFRDRWVMLCELKLRPRRNSFHLGGEYRLDSWALRGGAQRDAEERWQFSGGCGYRFDSFEVNVALESHNRFIQDGRGLALGLSLYFP